MCVLILIILFRGQITQSQGDFSSVEACQAAAHQIETALKGATWDGQAGRALYTCAPKGDK